MRRSGNKGMRLSNNGCHHTRLSSLRGRSPHMTAPFHEHLWHDCAPKHWSTQTQGGAEQSRAYRHHDLRSPACLLLSRQLLCSAGERAAAGASWLLITRETGFESRCFSKQHARRVFAEMPLWHLLLQARRCSSQPPPQLSGLLHIFRSFSILPSGAAASPTRRAPAQIQPPRTLPYSDANPLGAGFHIDVVDSDLWPASFGFSSDPAPGDACLDGFREHEEVHDSDDEIDDMRHRKKLFYKLDRGSKEFEENNLPLRRRWKRDKGNAKNPSECKEVEPDKSAPSKVPKLKAKPAVRKDDMIEVKRERVLSFNQMTDPYHHPFCLDIHVSKGSVRACFVHRVTSRVVSVAHSISKDMKFDLGSRKGMKACVAVGALLAKRAIEDDIHNAVYTPRKGDKIEGKIEVVLRGIIENGVDVKVKLKQRKPAKNTPVVPHVQFR